MSVAALTSPSTTARRQRILVVDDEIEMATVIEQALTRRGYDVTQLQSADAAWELLEHEDYDVVVTDINMRGMNGVELTE
ncbi:MAG TPA: response regulator, partial [Labilithrix sp.]|nr:response regulator [Labilithrix sp.]